VTAFGLALVGTALVGVAVVGAVVLAALAVSIGVLAVRVGRHWRVRRRWRRLYDDGARPRRRPGAMAQERLMAAPVLVGGAVSTVLAIVGLVLGGLRPQPRAREREVVGDELAQGQIGVAIGERGDENKVAEAGEGLDVAAGALAADHVDDAIDAPAAGQLANADNDIFCVVADDGARAEA